MKINLQKDTNQSWPEGGLESVPSCPICGSPNRSLLYGELTDRVFFSASGVWTLYECDDCHSAYLDPRPNLETISLAYGEGYYTHGVPANDAPPASFIGRMRRSLRNGYLNGWYGYQLEPATRLGALLIPFMRRTRIGATHWVGNLRRSSAANQLLDLGCGNGSFLARMEAMGWSAKGLEPDLRAVEAGRLRGLTIKHGILTSDTFSPASFDAVTISHVLEHLHNPAQVLGYCYKILRPGGTLSIITPNVSSCGHHYFRRYWVHLDPPRHLFIFTPNSLYNLLAAAGFEVVGPLANVPQVQLSFPWSVQVAAADKLVPTKKTYLNLAKEIKAANRRAQKNPAMDEELVFVAHKPTAQS